MLNSIKLHGYLGRDPELSYHRGQNGDFAKVVFTLAVGRDYGDDTDWFYCVMYGKRAEVIDKYLRKGSEVIVSGRMESYTPKGEERKSWLVKMDGFDFAGKKGDGSGSKKQSDQHVPDSMEQIEEDVPF